MNTATRLTLALVVLLVVGFGYFVYTTHPSWLMSDETLNSKAVVTKSVSYACSGDNTITAAYLAGEAKPATSTDQPPIPSGSVALVLSDGRTMNLAQTLSADGARYANTDESFVFWSKGNTALILEDNQERSFTGCVEVAS